MKKDMNVIKAQDYILQTHSLTDRELKPKAIKCMSWVTAGRELKQGTRLPTLEFFNDIISVQCRKIRKSMLIKK